MDLRGPTTGLHRRSYISHEFQWGSVDTHHHSNSCSHTTMSKPNDLRQRRANLKSVPSRDESQKSAALTLSWTEIPDWQKDNDYILTGYRHVQNSWAGCGASIFGCTHVYFSARPYPSLTPLSKICTTRQVSSPCVLLSR